MALIRRMVSCWPTMIAVAAFLVTGCPVPQSNAEFAFATCLKAIRKWRLAERHLPRTVDNVRPRSHRARSRGCARIRRGAARESGDES